MTGPITRAVLTGCLSALQYLSWAVSALALVALAAQWWRGDAQVSLGAVAALAAAFAVFGLICGWCARRLTL